MYILSNLNYEKIPYDQQIKFKQETVERIFKQAKIRKSINPMITNDSDKHYRHKVTASATSIMIDRRPKLRLGMFLENTHKIVPGFKSFIHDEMINDVLDKIEKLLSKYKISAYDIKKRQGIIKHVLIRKSYLNNDILVVFVTDGNFFPNAKKITQDLIKSFEQVKTVVQMMQNKHTPIALYGEEKTLYGKGYIEDGFNGLTFRLSAKSFYQVNPEQMIKLYEKALDMANIRRTDTVMDCYSGIGTISLLAAQKAREVIAIEINSQAVKDAKFNAKTNHITNVSFHCDDVEKFMYGFSKKVDILMLDPTRTGTTEKFLNAVKKMKPKHIIYISCFPETQARDIKSLLSMYYIKEIQPVDMFSYTEHVENIVLLSLKNN